MVYYAHVLLRRFREVAAGCDRAIKAAVTCARLRLRSGARFVSTLGLEHSEFRDLGKHNAAQCPRSIASVKPAQ